MKVTLTGFKELQRTIQRAPDRITTYAGDAVKATAGAVSQRAKGLAPRDTGNLQRAIRSEASGTLGRVLIDGADYWRFVEYGTVHMAARPFIRTATETESSAFEQRVRDVGQKLERDWSTGR